MAATKTELTWIASFFFNPEVMKQECPSRVVLLFADAIFGEEFSDHPTAHDVLEVVSLLHATEGTAVAKLPSSASTWPAIIKQSYNRYVHAGRETGFRSHVLLSPVRQSLQVIKRQPGILMVVLGF